MPLYTFEAEDGSVIEEYAEMSEAPRVGATIERDGKVYTRVYDYGRTTTVLVEPDWAHTVYQAGPAEAAEWRRRGGVCDETLDMPRLRNRAEIDAYRGMTADMHKGQQDNRYDHGIFRSR